MKGFIEVTDSKDNVKVLMSISSIDFIRENYIVQYANTNHVTATDVKESYEQIKELIKQAQ